MLYRSTHEQRLERWLGADLFHQMQNNMRDWYGPPIYMLNVPGYSDGIRIHAGGDVTGVIAGGTFSSLSDLIAEATAGKSRWFTFMKVGPAGGTAITSSLLQVGNSPAAAANAAAAPGGIANVASDTGFPPFTNPTSPDTQHITQVTAFGTVSNMTLLLFDCLFRVNKTMASTATEAVTGVPTRYQNTTGGTVDSAEGNFLFIQVGLTALAATAHNWTVCTYTDQGGTTGVTLPSVTGNASAIVHRLDQPQSTWFCPLAAGDSGIKNLTQMQSSASVATGVINFVIGHPLVWIPLPSLANVPVIVDGINTAFNLNRVFDDAALALLDVHKSAATGTNYNVILQTVAG